MPTTIHGDFILRNADLLTDAIAGSMEKTKSIAGSSTPMGDEEGWTAN